MAVEISVIDEVGQGCSVQVWQIFEESSNLFEGILDLFSLIINFFLV